MLNITELINECDTISEAVDVINEEHGVDGSAEIMAAKFAIIEAERSGRGVDEDSIEEGLYDLAEHGADFNHASALDLAVEFSEL